MKMIVDYGIEPRRLYIWAESPEDEKILKSIAEIWKDPHVIFYEHDPDCQGITNMEIQENKN